MGLQFPFSKIFAQRFLIIVVILTGLSFTGKAQWQEGGAVLTDRNGDDYRMKTAPRPGGGCYVLWTSYSTTDTCLKLLALDAYGRRVTGWPENGQCVSPEGDFHRGEVVVDALGNIFAISSGSPTQGGLKNVYVQKLNDAGQMLWNGGLPLVVSPGGNYNHQSTGCYPDGSGGLAVVWSRFDVNIGPTTPDILVQYIDASGSVASGWNAQGLVLSAEQDVRETIIRSLVDKAGDNLYVLYIRTSYPSGDPQQAEVFVKKIILATGQPDAAWPAQGLRLSAGYDVNSLSFDKDLYLFEASDGKLLALWNELIDTWNGELLASSFNPNGTYNTSGRWRYVAGFDGSGGLANIQASQMGDSVWVSFTNLAGGGMQPTLAIRINMQGQVLDSLRVSHQMPLYALALENMSRIVATSDGGAYVFYQQPMPEQGNENMIYVHHLLPDATLDPLFGEYGMPIGTISVYNSLFRHEDMSVVVTGDTAYLVWNYGPRATTDLELRACNVLPDGRTCVTATPTGCGTVLTVDIEERLNCINKMGEVVLSAPHSTLTSEYAVDNKQYNGSPSFTNLNSGWHWAYARTGGCEDSVHFYLMPRVVVNVVQTAINEGAGSISIQGYGGVPPYTYHRAGGTASPQVYGDFSALPNGFHQLVVTDHYGCTDTLKFNFFRVSRDLPTHPDIKVYPNPTTTTLYLQVPQAMYGTATLADATGRTLATKQLMPNMTWDMAPLAAGLYFVIIQTDKETYRYRIVHE